MTNLDASNLGTFENTIIKLVPIFDQLLEDYFYKTQSISRQLFYSKCNYIIKDLYLQSVNFRILIKDHLTP